MLNDLFSHLYCIYLLWKFIDKNRLEDISEITGFLCIYVCIQIKYTNI